MVELEADDCLRQPRISRRGRSSVKVVIWTPDTLRVSFDDRGCKSSQEPENPQRAFVREKYLRLAALRFRTISPSWRGGRRLSGASGIAPSSRATLHHHCRIDDFPPAVWRVIARDRAAVQVSRR